MSPHLTPYDIELEPVFWAVCAVKLCVFVTPFVGTATPPKGSRALLTQTRARP